MASELQGKPEALGDVVRSLKSVFNLQHVYVWHGLSAYWSGVSVDDEGVSQYNSRIIFAEPTPGLKEIEPSMGWNPSVVSGIGVPQSAAQLYTDMHTYLSGSGMRCSHINSVCVRSCPCRLLPTCKLSSTSSTTASCDVPSSCANVHFTCVNLISAREASSRPACSGLINKVMCCVLAASSTPSLRLSGRY